MNQTTRELLTDTGHEVDLIMSFTVIDVHTGSSYPGGIKIGSYHATSGGNLERAVEEVKKGISSLQVLKNEKMYLKLCFDFNHFPSCVSRAFQAEINFLDLGDALGVPGYLIYGRNLLVQNIEVEACRPVRAH